MRKMLPPLLVSLIPLNGLRVLLYRLLFGYRIGRGVRIGSDAKIGRLNQFFCSWYIVSGKFSERNYTPILEMGNRTLVLNSHFFDIYGRIEIGNDSWIAGNGSQFWTHGLSVVDRDIIIGEKNYIGSAVRFAPGTSIGSRNIVALKVVDRVKLADVPLVHEQFEDATEGYGSLRDGLADALLEHLDVKPSRESSVIV